MTLAVLASLHGGDAYFFLFVLLAAAGIGAPWGQDVVLLAAAALTLQGGMTVLPMMLVAAAALLAGDALSVWVGRHYGARWIRRPWAAKLVAPARLPALEERMRRSGTALSFLTRFLPGQRGTLFFLFGTLRLPWRGFLLADGAAALVQVALFTYGVRALGWQWPALRAPFESADDVLTLSLIVLLLLAWTRLRRADS